MTKQEFIHQFIEENGYLPDEETIQELFPHTLGRRAHISHFGNRRSTQGRSEDLLFELKGIFNDIAAFAKASAIRKPLVSKSSGLWASELGYMTLIFMAKTGLYFVLKSTHEAGYDFSNI